LNDFEARLCGAVLGALTQHICELNLFALFLVRKDDLEKGQSFVVEETNSLSP
jgi:hypothetical protein